KTAPDGTETVSAHPARFSPEDKFSKYRVIIKKRFGVLPTQKAKTWRRIVRQKIRASVPRPVLTYQQWAKRRLVISFILFFIGWKAFGVTLSDMVLWTVDENSGEGRFVTPVEGRERRLESERARNRRLRNTQSLPQFDFDD
ncbi:unnamed protein product, partial [Angiostrongylus costaricensis]|uniref:Nucleolar protein 10 n=1 Tax=Angiostrongylus costaricensis TaxID=334426 RepID=A0A0R3PDZ3_ANGCS